MDGLVGIHLNVYSGPANDRSVYKDALRMAPSQL